MSSSLYTIEFVVGEKTVRLPFPKTAALTLEYLSTTFLFNSPELEGRRLSFFWRDEEDDNIPVEKASDLREVIQAMTKGGSSTLRFHVTAESVPEPAISEEPAEISISPPQIEETKPLAELSVEEVVRLFTNLDMPTACCDKAREQKITGRVLCYVEDLYDVRDCGLTQSALDNEHAKRLVENVLEMQWKGVPVSYLQVGKIISRYKIIPPTPDQESNKSREEVLSGGTILSNVLRWLDKAEMGGLSPLYLASEAGDVEGVQALLEHTSDISPFESNYVKEFMRLSVEDRVEQFMRAEEGEYQFTPLHIAAERGHTETVILLIAFKANMEGKDWFQRTPLHLAVGNGHLKTAIALIEHKANINATNESRNTPLHFASSGGHKEIVSILLAHGAKTHAITDNGQTPLDFAENEDVKDLLRNVQK